MDKATAATERVELYSRTARFFHWSIVALIVVQAPLGVYMAYRGNTLEIWDALTGGLYTSHKLIGVTILVVVLCRLAYRLTHGTPADEPTLEPWQKIASHLNHWGMYVLLLCVPIAGYIGISLYPALDKSKTVLVQYFDFVLWPAIVATVVVGTHPIAAGHVGLTAQRGTSWLSGPVCPGKRPNQIGDLLGRQLVEPDQARKLFDPQFLNRVSV